ncbi:serine/threonine-protein kinase PpkA [Anaerolineae bacterium]|nr:serine/threonine-protein kinase PpkA [Anaerolineae bacterium]
MAQKFREYIVKEKLGQGGMGTVYLCEHDVVGQTVALKVLNPQLTSDPQFRERFVREAKVMAKLNHPNIVKLLNFFEEPEGSVMVMDYFEGHTINQMIAKRGPIPEEEAKYLVRQMLLAVGYAHKQGIIHRDIKPSNILVNKDNLVGILDFGIAKMLEDVELTKTGTMLGSLYYMSPEQIKGARDADHRTDIYSIGVTMYQMLAGRLPFNTPSTLSEYDRSTLIRKIVEEEFPAPVDFYPYISNAMVKYVNRMIAKNPDHRFKTCEEAIHVLDNVEKFFPEDEADATGIESGEKTILDAGEKTIIDSGERTVLDAQPIIPPKPAPQPVRTEPKRETPPPPPPAAPEKKKSSAGLIFGIIAVILVAAGIGAYFMLSGEPESPGEKETLIATADSLYTAGNMDDALAKYEKVLTLDANDAHSKNRIDEIKKKNLKPSPDEQFAALRKTGDSAFAANDFVTASSFYEQALAVKQDADVKTKLEEARKKLEESGMKDKQFEENKNRADAFYRQKNYENALRYYQMAAGIKPEDTYVQNQIKACNREIQNQANNNDQRNSGTLTGTLKLTDPYGDRFTYTGEVKNGKANGKGKATFDDGAWYEGDFVNNLMQGQGTYLYNTGDRYVGAFANGYRDGRGTYYFKKSGDKYVGQWRQNKQHGQGTYTWADGSSYSGDWISDKRQGQGTYKWTNGDRYVGSWSEGKREGQGSYIWADGSKYVGGFRDNKFHGQGKEYDKNGNLTRDGRYADDKYLGK